MNIEIWLVTIFNGVLVFILSLILKPVIDYLKAIVTETKGFRKDVESLKENHADATERFERGVHKVYSVEANIWRELNKLRRSVVMSNLVIRKRKSEVNQILEESRRAKDRLDSYQKIAEAASKVARFHNTEIKSLKTEMVNLKNDMILIKSEGNNEGN
jgi:hypothetical protein